MSGSEKYDFKLEYAVLLRCDLKTPKKSAWLCYFCVHYLDFLLPCLQAQENRYVPTPNVVPAALPEEEEEELDVEAVEVVGFSTPSLFNILCLLSDFTYTWK